MLYWLFFSFLRKELPNRQKPERQRIRQGYLSKKDGLYSARYVDEQGKRHKKYFPTLPEARNWLKQAKEAPIPEDELFIPSEMTVDTWFEFWINNIVGDFSPNTRRNYSERYRHNIQPVIGKMRLTDVKPMYCKMVLNRMDATYAGSTTRQTYIAIGTMLRSAVMNDLIPKHPMLPVQSRAVCSLRFCKSFSAMPASKPQWTVMSM